MNITPIQKSGWLELRVEGRLDAAWSEHFYETVAALVREGRHDIRIDALKLEYLSSAGMRAMLRAHKELASVSGTFAIVRASDFVAQTLSMSGFDSLLALDTASEEDTAANAEQAETDGTSLWKRGGMSYELHELDLEAGMSVSSEGDWTPWQVVEADKCSNIPLGRDAIGIGTGAPGEDFAQAKDNMGDFAAAAGCVAWQPGNGADAPDYLVQEGRFVPELIAANGLRATGGFSHLLRFQPEGNAASLPLTGLLDAVLSATRSTSAAFVALAEIEG
ncbi:MAG: STAS domain-containing protein, partial [Opitutales bacterium]